MNIVRNIVAYVVSVAAAYVTGTVFYTQQVLSKQAAFGVTYTPGQWAQTLLANVQGFWLYAAMLAIALAIGFIVAAILKRILKPLAPIAYPVAGVASVLALIYLIENLVIPGGVGAIGGARDAVGIALQGVAGLVGGILFAIMRR